MDTDSFVSKFESTSLVDGLKKFKKMQYLFDLTKLIFLPDVLPETIDIVLSKFGREAPETFGIGEICSFKPREYAHASKDNEKREKILKEFLHLFTV